MIETWNKQLSDEKVHISDDGSCVDIVNDELSAIFGAHIVKYGDAFQWELKLNKTDSKIENFPSNFICCVGLVPNKEDLLKIKHEDHLSQWDKNGYILSAINGGIYFDDMRKEYCTSNSFTNDGDILQIKFNWNKSTLHFISNGKDFGNCMVTLQGETAKFTDDKQAEFRLAICVLNGKGAAIMIQGQEII